MKFFLTNEPIDLALVKRLVSGAFWNSLIVLWSKGFSFVGTVIIIRIIGREAFGEFGMLNSTIAMFGMFTAFSVSQSSTKYIAENREINKDKTGRIIGMSFLISFTIGFLLMLVVLFFSDYIASGSLNAPHLSTSLKILSIALLFGSLNGVQNGIISGFESFKSNAIFNLFLNVILIFIKIFLAYRFMFFGAVLGIVFEPLFVFISTFFLARRILKKGEITVKFNGIFKEARVLINYSLPTILTGLIVFPVNWYVMTLLARAASGYYEVGAYNVANQWFNLLIFIPYILVSSFLPVFSNLLSEERGKEIIGVVKKTNALIIFILFPVVLFFLFFGDWFAVVVYGPNFQGLGTLISISILTLIPQGISIVFSNLLAAIDKMWIAFWINLFWAIILVISSNLLLQYGAMGVVLAKLLSFSLSVILMWKQFIKWKYNFSA